MAVSERTIRVHGLRDLSRAFAAADKRLKNDLRDRLKRAAEPVRDDAEASASREIRNVQAGDSWSQMRVGVTTRLVYVAPRERGIRARGSGRRRPNLAGLLMDRAMKPALERNENKVVRELEQLVDDVGRDWERA